MRNVNFVEVGMKNFGPYIDPMILEFPNDSLTLLTGPNGIGKTMALDALSFTLFGSTSKGARGDDLVNNVVGRNCHTWSKFFINENSYLVDRYHKYTKLGNTVTISKNGEEPYKKGQKEVLPEVERLLCPKKSFMNTLMFGQKIKDFFTDLVDSDKKDIFRKILNLMRYEIFYKKATEILKELENNFNELQNKMTVNIELQNDIKEQIKILKEQKKTFYTDKENDIKDLRQSISQNESMYVQWKKKLKKLQEMDSDSKSIMERLLQLEREEEAIDAQIKAEEETLENQKQLKISELTTQATSAKQKVNQEYNKKAQNKKDYYMKVNSQLTDEIAKFFEERSQIDIDINRHQDAINNADCEKGDLLAGLDKSTCPTCLQKISEDCRENLNQKIKAIDDEAARRNKLIEDDLTPMKKMVFQKIGSLNDKKNEAKKIMEIDVKDCDLISQQLVLTADKKLTDTVAKVNELSDTHLKTIEKKYLEKLTVINNEQQQLLKKGKQSESLAKDIDETEMTIATLEKTIIQKQHELKTKRDLEYDKTQLSSYEKKKRDLAIGMDVLKKNFADTQDEITINQFWKSAFSSTGIPSMLIDEAIPFMNKQVSHYLDKLTNGRYIVSFDTLAETKGGDFRDKISVNVLDTYTRASSRIQLSGGQTRIIDIATILTLGDLQSNIQEITFNILLFDEIFDSLDEENIGFVSKVLSNMKVGKSIYLISHRHEDQLEADNVLVLN